LTFTAKPVRIYRKTLAADTFTSLADSEKIILNGNKTDNTIENGWTTQVSKGASRAIAAHPNPNENLGEQQDTGLDEDVYTIIGSISRADLAVNSFINNLETWNEEAQEFDVELPFGRFSIEIDRAPGLNKIADATDGLEIRSLDWDMKAEEQNETVFTLVLSRGKEVS